jgi:hypothetical protein
MQDGKSEFQIGVPDPAFRLNAEERASVLPGFDVDALERLLSMYPPEGREQLLKRFQPTEDGRGRMLMRIDHPALQAVLEEVWAPHWLDYPDEAAIDAEVDYIPGREIAKQRRRAEAESLRSE